MKRLIFYILAASALFSGASFLSHGYRAWRGICATVNGENRKPQNVTRESTGMPRTTPIPSVQIKTAPIKIKIGDAVEEQGYGPVRVENMTPIRTWRYAHIDTYECSRYVYLHKGDECSVVRGGTETAVSVTRSRVLVRYTEAYPSHEPDGTEETCGTGVLFYMDKSLFLRMLAKENVLPVPSTKQDVERLRKKWSSLCP